METVLIVGATGNIGVSAVKAVLQTGRNVLAAVRNQASAEKLFHHVGTKEGITTVEADVCSENGVQGIVDSVKAGKLPAFQHVYAAGLFLLHGFRAETSFANMRGSWWWVFSYAVAGCQHRRFAPDYDRQL
jgi:short-subunit dehydrogenase